MQFEQFFIHFHQSEICIANKIPLTMQLITESVCFYFISINFFPLQNFGIEKLLIWIVSFADLSEGSLWIYG